MDESSRHDRFMQLFLPAQSGLFGYLRTLIPNTADAEDVLQAAAAVMWEKFDDFQPGTQFLHWAYHIAKLQALRHLKDRKRSKLVFSDDVVTLLADRTEAVSQRTSDVIDTLEVCIDQLPQQDRELLTLRFATDATSRSVAHDVGRSEMSISRSLNRIYGDLLDCLERHDAAAASASSETSSRRDATPTNSADSPNRGGRR
jgi:RNA polymerase sigma-70 factor, ECF subfamily